MSIITDNERFRNLLLSWPAKAISFLYEAYYKTLLTISERLTHNREASEDIVQETFAHVWLKHKELSQQHDQSIQFYLIKVVKYKSITFYKKKSQEDTKYSGYKNGMLVDHLELSREERLILDERSNTLRKIISTFPKREKECLLLRLDYNLSVTEIALQLGISNKAVERSLTSAKKRLKKFKHIIS